MEPWTELELEAQLTDSERSDFEAIASVNHYPAGNILLGNGEETDFVLFIVKGFVKIVIPGPPERIVGLRGPGQIVGEMAAIRRKPRSASVFAVGRVDALFLPGYKWLQFLHEHPRAALAQIYTADERLAEATRKTVESFLGAQQRLAKAMVELEESGPAIPGPEGVKLPFSQQDLAAIAGVGVDSVKQVFKIFRENKVISTARKATTITDSGTLRAVARGDQSLSLPAGE
jgi:CRP/FNR family cyclic AMP-dependent transcriptional regulator